MEKINLGYIYLILFSISGGLIGVTVKMTKGLDSYSLVFLRATTAFIFLFFVILSRKKIQDLRPYKLHRTMLVGFFEGLSILFYFLAITHTTVSKAIFLAYLAPVYSMIFSRIFLKEKIQKRSIWGLILAIIGVVLIIDFNIKEFSGFNVGDIYGLLCGLFYAAMAITAKPITLHKSSYYISFWQYMTISIMFVLFYKPDITLLMMNWWQILIMGIVCSGISFVLFMEGVKRVKGQDIFIVTSLEPFFGTVMAFFFLNEIPSAYTIIGGIIIIIGIYIISNKKK